MLGLSKPGALNCCTFFRLIPLTLFVFRNLTLIYLPLFRSMDSLLCDPIASTPDLVFFSIDVTDASGGFIIFVRQGLSFYDLSISSLDPYSDYVEITISLNDSSSLSFLNVYAPPIRSSRKDNRTNFFSPSYVEAVDFSRFRRKRISSASLGLTLFLEAFRKRLPQLRLMTFFFSRNYATFGQLFL